MKKDVLRNFTKFTGKHLCQSLRPATLLKKRLWQRYFPVNFAKFLRTPFLQNTSGWLLLNLSLTGWFSEADVAVPIIFSKYVFLKTLQYWSLFLIIKLQGFLRWLLLIFCGSKYFFAAEYGIYCSVAPVFVLDSFENTSYTSEVATEAVL